MVSLCFMLALLMALSYSSSASEDPTPLNIIFLTAPSAEARASCLGNTTSSTTSTASSSSSSADDEDSCEVGGGGGGEGSSRCIGVEEAVQLAVKRLNRNSTLLGGYNLTVTHHTASQVARPSQLPWG